MDPLLWLLLAVLALAAVVFFFALFIAGEVAPTLAKGRTSGRSRYVNTARRP